MLRPAVIGICAMVFCGLFFPDEGMQTLRDGSPEDTASGYERSTLNKEPELKQEDIPGYSGEPYAVIHDDRPYFTEEDYSRAYYSSYSPLDELGRCHSAMAGISRQTMPTKERGPIGDIRPSGWQKVKYPELIEDNYLYNRCHLIGYQLAGENDNERNLITGTRYFNVEGMLPFENEAAAYVQGCDDHLLYRVTPIYKGENLVASGVLMEAASVEDQGEDFHFCVYVYNVQPGIVIDYATGDSRVDETAAVQTKEDVPKTFEVETPANKDSGLTKWGDERYQQSSQEVTYVLNTRSKKYHKPTCDSVQDMKEKNRQEFTGTKQEAEAKGYSPCSRCIGK